MTELVKLMDEMKAALKRAEYHKPEDKVVLALLRIEQQLVRIAEALERD